MLRSALAVIAGIATFSLLLLGMSVLGTQLFGAEPEWINRSLATQLAWLLWNVVSMAVGGCVTASSAPRAFVQHAVVMAAIQTVFSLIAFFTVTPNTSPTWLWVAGMVLNIPAAISGARLRRGVRA